MDKDKKSPAVKEKSDENPNHFPEGTISQRRELPDEGDDMREPFEEGAGNNGTTNDADKTKTNKP